jgi:hypothetical protein
VRVFINIGPGTKPDTFRFHGNAWYCIDDPDREPRGIPGTETESVVGVDPQIRFDPRAFELEAKSTAPELRGVGAEAWSAK